MMNSIAKRAVFFPCIFTAIFRVLHYCSLYELSTTVTFSDIFVEVNETIDEITITITISSRRSFVS